MALTYTLIQSTTLGSNTSSVTLSSIPQTYDDLVLRASVRTTLNAFKEPFWIRPNSTASGYSETWMYGVGSGALSSRQSSATAWYEGMYINANSSTSNTFSQVDVYLPNYAVTATKTMSAFVAFPTANTNEGQVQADSGTLTNTAAFTSLFLLPSTGDFVTGSSFYLYGIKNS